MRILLISFLTLAEWRQVLKQDNMSLDLLISYFHLAVTELANGKA